MISSYLNPTQIAGSRSANDGLTDPFSIEIRLVHPKYSATDITDVLAVAPTYSYTKGDQPDGSTPANTTWFARLSDGVGFEDYSRSLEHVVLFLDKQKIFLSDLSREGEAEIILNHRTFEDEGKTFELFLAPEFLNALSSIGMGLRVQTWNIGFGSGKG